MRILFIGDIVGKPGRDIVAAAVPRLKVEKQLDLVVANAENAAGGSGLTPAIYRELIRSGIDAVTLGDHVYRRKEIYSVLEGESNIVKPANLPPESVGRNWAVVTAANGVPVAIACFLGQLFMRPVDVPWQSADRVLAAILFEQTMDREIEGKPTATFLWEEKKILPILNID